jgi:acyl-CoA thioester hydrolase
LKSNDAFLVTVTMKKEGIRWIFLQDILRLPDHKMVVRARVDTVAVVNGKLTDYKPLEAAFGYNQQIE